MKPLIEIANQLFTLEKKTEKESHTALYARQIQRMKASLEEMGITYHNPEGEKYSETRTDVEANITGNPTNNMKILDVIKPIVIQNGSIVQTGVVIVGE